MLFRNTAVLLLLLWYSAAYSQTDARKSKPSFHALASAGLLEGGRSSSFQLQLVNGIACRTWFAGIGAGIDYYFVRSIPVAAYVEKRFARLPVFVYGSAGIHYVWQRDIGDDLVWYNGSFNNGFYYDGGIGYRFPVGSRGAIRLTVGFSEKQMEETRTQNYSWAPPYKEIFEYRLQRLSLKAGFQF